MQGRLRLFSALFILSLHKNTEGDYMRARHKQKLFKQVAEMEAAQLENKGYQVMIKKMTTSNNYVVYAENKTEEKTIFIDRPNYPFHTWTRHK